MEIPSSSHRPPFAATPTQLPPQNIQERLISLIDGARQSWTYAISWKSTPSDASPSFLAWEDGYYHGCEEEKSKPGAGASTPSRAEQEYRKRVFREFSALISRGDDSPDEITDTEWFFLVSMTQTFAPGAGIPGQALFSGSPVWLTGADAMAEAPCERARQARAFGLRTMACVPLVGGAVVELGSTREVDQSSEFLNKIRPLFDHRNYSGRPLPESSTLPLQDPRAMYLPIPQPAGSLCVDKHIPGEIKRSTSSNDEGFLCSSAAAPTTVVKLEVIFDGDSSDQSEMVPSATEPDKRPKERGRKPAKGREEPVDHVEA